MLVTEVLQEVVTLPEAVMFSHELGYELDRSNLRRYAKSGRLLARKSHGTWLTTRSAIQALILDIATEVRGRPRLDAPDWAIVSTTPEIERTLAQIDELQSQINQIQRSEAEYEQFRQTLIVEAIYHTNRIEGNRLSLPEVRAVVEAFWAEQDEPFELVGDVVNGQSST